MKASFEKKKKKKLYKFISTPLILKEKQKEVNIGLGKGERFLPIFSPLYNFH